VGALKGKGARFECRKPPKSKFKNSDFVETMILNALGFLIFSRNQPQKSADDYSIRVLKNKIINLGRLREN
jgi:hypothetical protein